MSNIIDLLAAQLLKDNASDANPYSGAASGISSVLATMPQYNLKPWESLLAGAIGGFASGALKGYGQQSQDRKSSEITQKLLSALDSSGGIDSEAIEATPELAKYAPLLKLNEIQQKKEETAAIEKIRQELLTKAPYEIKSGEEIQTYKIDPQTMKPVLVAQAPREIFSPSERADSALMYPGLPKNMQDNAMTQEVISQDNAKVDRFAADQFEKAKGIPSRNAFFPGTTEANEITGIQVALTTAVQKALGREMNAREQEQLRVATPDWNDTVDQIDKKKERYLDLINAISKSSPLIEKQPSAARVESERSSELTQERMQQILDEERQKARAKYGLK